MAQKATFPTIESRYQRVRYKNKLDSRSLLFELERPIENSTRVIVDAEEVKGLKNPSNIKELFLTHITGTRNWYAKTWTRDENPWVNETLFPSPNDVLETRVISFIGDTAAILKPTNKTIPVEYYLHRSKLPLPYRKENIRNILSLNDLVSGLSSQPDPARLRVSLNADKWIDNCHHSWMIREPKDWLIPVEKLVKSRSNVSGMKTAKRSTNILIIDDDPLLCELMVENLQDYASSVKSCSKNSPKGLLNYLYEALRESHDVILFDFQLELPELEQRYAREAVESYLERTPECACCIISGNLDSAKEFAFENQYGYLSKPVDLKGIKDWIASPEPCSKEEFEGAKRLANKLFSVESQTATVVETTNRMLDSLCDRLGVSGGALWLLLGSKEGYELRANTKNFKGTVTRNVLQELQNSIIGNTVSLNTASDGILPQNDPLQDILVNQKFSSQETFYLTVPLLLTNQTPRCIVLFNDRPFSSMQKRRVLDRADHFELLIDSINRAEQLDEISASAQQGRIALATLHELRREINNLKLLLSDDKRTLQYRVDFANEVLLPNSSALSKEQLGNFVMERDHKINVKKAVQEICSSMSLYVADNYRRDSIELQFKDLGLGEREISLNPMPVERALINLIDNAASFISKREDYGYETAKKVWVFTDFDKRSDLERPIKIRVIDSGPGMSNAEAESVFLPRKSSRAAESMGMGLYLTREVLSGIGGQIEIIERPRWLGAGFEISLPLVVG